MAKRGSPQSPWRPSALAGLILCCSAAAWALPVCERTPEVRDAIVDEARVDSCEDVDATALSRIYSIFLYRLDSLKEGDFRGLTSLEYLYLEERRLTALPAGVFDGLTSLERLYLGRNHLSALPVGVFDGLIALESLYLDRNHLSALPVGVFNGLTRLQRLDLSNNRLTTLPTGVFDGLISLSSLDLGDNDLADLPAGAFDGLPSLWRLDLSFNRLSALSADLFRGLTSLGSLYLEGNCLDLPADYFAGDGRFLYVPRLDNQNELSLCKQSDTENPIEPDSEELEARSFWRGWRLILLERT